MYVSEAALTSAHATATSGQYGIVDPGPGDDAVIYIWDEDEGWVAGGSAGGGTFASTTGDPYDNANLEAALNDKLDAIPTSRPITGAHTLDATDLASVNAGGQLEINGNSTGALTVPLNATVAFPVGAMIGATLFTGSVIATGGVTINGTRGDLTIPSGSKIYLEKTATDTWTLYNGEPNASSSTRGLAKLYPTTGVNTDGAMDQNSITNAINSAIASAIQHSDLNLTGL
jgi:hypothetical protein